MKYYKDICWTLGYCVALPYLPSRLGQRGRS